MPISASFDGKPLTRWEGFSGGRPPRFLFISAIRRPPCARPAVFRLSRLWPLSCRPPARGGAPYTWRGVDRSSGGAYGPLQAVSGILLDVRAPGGILFERTSKRRGLQGVALGRLQAPVPRPPAMVARGRPARTPATSGHSSELGM